MFVRKIKQNVKGSLKDAIKQHGPIQLDNLESVTKRIVGNLSNIFYSYKKSKESKMKKR